MFHFWNQIIDPLLNILLPKEILQVGSGTGLLSKKLAEYAHIHGVKITIIDHFPVFDLAAFRRRFADVLTFHRSWSIDALPLCTPAELVIIDGDHNWFTVFHELQAIDVLAKKSGKFPIILLQNVCWPYARRDAYVLPGIIPEKFRQEFVEGGVLPKTERIIANSGLNERMFHASKLGGPQNGVLTALEDFLALTHQKLSVTILEGFFGIAIITPTELLERYPKLQEHLSSLHFEATAKKHLEALEESRIEALLAARDLRYVVESLRVQRDSYRLAMDELSAKNHQKDLEIARKERTLSWRLTTPLRRAGNFLSFIGKKKSWCGKLKNIWSFFGEPFPGIVRFVRYQFLGTLFPVTPSVFVREAQQAQATQDAYGGAVPVSIIVTARNNGEFLRECLESILAQTVHPLEIIYCDDGSDDQSVAIASSFPRIRVLSYPHRGVVVARNAAVAESKGDLLLHIDGDDIIPPEYLRHHLDALANSNGAAFSYGGSVMFGLENGIFSSDHSWDLKRLWTRNYINTSSLIRRSAFEAVGGWRDVVGTLWDWDLWLRISRIGHGVPSKAVLQYRRHERSWSQVQRQFGFDDVGFLFGRLRRAVAQVSICSIVSGRLPELMQPWIDALVLSIQGSESGVNAPELIILDNSTDGMEDRIRTALEKYPGVFRSVLIVPYPVRFSFSSEMERRHQVSKFLATAYNRIFQMADGEIVWFLEDDILVPPCAYEILLRDLTDGELPPAAVSGLYRARHMDQLVAHHVVNGISVPVKDQHVAPLEIDLGGTGCMMAFRPFILHPFTSHWRGGAPAHDWAWCDAIRADGYRIILDPRVRCKHYQNLTTYV